MEDLLNAIRQEHIKIHQVWPHYPFKPILRNEEHKYKSNNWLKQHGKPMRRHPFKKAISYIFDEFHLIHTSLKK